MLERFTNGLKIIFFILAFSMNFHAISLSDFTIVGFFGSEEGIGKHPITILETLGNDTSVNFICTTPKPNLGMELTPRAEGCINNPDHEGGKVAMLTELIWSLGVCPADKMPQNSYVKLAYSVFETTQIPTKWVSILNSQFDAVVVPDIYVSNLYQNSGVQIPIFVLPLPMILDPYLAKEPHSEKPSKPFVFIDASANKNPLILIKAFARVFKNNPNVVLLLRAVWLDRGLIDAAIKKYKLWNVIVEEGGIPLSKFIDRLTAADCFINLSRGEGFSFIPRECLALGLPVIITNNTASKTICDSGFVRAVPSDIKGPAREHYNNLFGEKCGEQFDCSVKDAAVAMKDVYENYSKYIQKARQGREWVQQYDCKNPILQARYQTLVKPKQVIFGEENLVTENAIITNSEELYHKYLKVIQSL